MEVEVVDVIEGVWITRGERGFCVIHPGSSSIHDYIWGYGRNGTPEQRGGRKFCNTIEELIASTGFVYAQRLATPGRPLRYSDTLIPTGAINEYVRS